MARVTTEWLPRLTRDDLGVRDRDQFAAANKVFDRVRAMYVDLEQNGRRDVLRRLREGLPAASPDAHQSGRA